MTTPSCSAPNRSNTAPDKQADVEATHPHPAAPASGPGAEAGWSVCLVEANQDVGGSGRTLPGFHHDLGAGFLALAMISPAIADRDLAAFGLRFRHAPVPAAHPLPGGRAIAVGRPGAETAASATPAA